MVFEHNSTTGGQITRGHFDNGGGFIEQRYLGSSTYTGKSFDSSGSLLGTATCSLNCNSQSNWSTVSGSPDYTFWKEKYISEHYSVAVNDPSGNITNDKTYLIVSTNANLPSGVDELGDYQGIVGVFRKNGTDNYTRAISSASSTYHLYTSNSQWPASDGYSKLNNVIVTVTNK